MDAVRLACVRYLNTAPLIEGLEKVAGVALLPAAPSAIAGMVLGSEADLGLCSIVDGARGVGEPSDGGLALVPAGMIGCDGPTLTVRLHSAVPLARLGVLHADVESHTSVVLAQVVLALAHGARPAIAGFDASAGGAWPEAVLLIGDKVVTGAPPAARYPYQLDLGEAWKELTGLPFVYAMWMCRAAEGGSARIATAAAVLDRQRRHNATRLEWIVGRRAAAAGWPAPLARRYLGELLRYEVGPRERAGVARFLSEAVRLGLIAGDRTAWADVGGDARAGVAAGAGAAPSGG